MADLANLKRQIDDLTDEELLDLMRTTEAEEARSGDASVVEKPAQKPKVKVDLGEGDVLEVDSAEEAQRLLLARLTEARRTREEAPPVEKPQPPARTEFNMDDFAKKFLQDPDAAIDYLDSAKIGAPVRKMIPALVNTVMQLANKVREIETQRFVESSDYEPSTENRRAIQTVMQERGWEPSAVTLSDAYAIAKNRGMIKTTKKHEEPQEEREQPFVPPRVNRGSSKPLENIAEMADGMSDEQLETALMKAGLINRSYFRG